MTRSPASQRSRFRRGPAAIIVIAVALLLSLGAGALSAQHAAAAAALTITNTPSPNPVPPGAIVTFTVVVTNTSATTATDVIVADNLSGLSGPAATTTAGTCGGRGAALSCSTASLAAGGVVTMTFSGTVTSPAGSNVTNTATLSYKVGGVLSNGSATATAPVGGPALPDLTIAIAAPVSVAASSPLAYTLTVGNQGSQQASNITVVDHLPTGMVFVNASGNSGFTCTQQNATVTCSGGTLAAGGSATITINVTTPSTGGSLKNTAAVDPFNTIAESNENNNTAEATTVVNAAPPPGGALTIAATDSPDPVQTAGTLTYTLTIQNNFGWPLSGVTVTEGINGIDPATVTTNPSAGSCTVGTIIVNCTIPSLAAGQVVTITIAGKVTAGANTSINNNAQVTAYFRAPYTATASTSTAVQPNVDLTIDAVASPSPVQSVTPLTYTLTVHNSGIGNATGVAVRDTLPAGVTFTSATGTNGFSCTQAGGVVNCTGGSVAGNGGTATITIVVTSPGVTGKITDNATVDPNNTIPEIDETNNNASVDTMVTTGINLDAHIAGVPDPVAPSGLLTYTLTVNNTGTQNASGVKVTDILPAGVTFVSATGDSGLTCNQAGGTVTCVGGAIAAGAHATITINVLAPAAPTTITDQMEVDPDHTIDELNENDNKATATTSVALGGGGVQIDLTLGMTASAPSVAPDGSLTYTLTAGNGGSVTAFNVALRDVLPAGSTYVSAGGDKGFVCNQVNGVVTCGGGTLNPGAAGNATITIVIRAPHFVGASSITNQATIDPDNLIAESNETNNSASVTTTLQATVDLVMGMIGLPAKVLRGSTHNYTLTVQNAGTDGATGVEVVDSLPVGVSVLNIQADSGFRCSMVNNLAVTVDCTGGTIAAGATATITIMVSVNTVTTDANPTPITNTATVDPNNTIIETNENNNTASSTSLVKVTGIDLVPQISAAPSPVTRGNNLTYTVTVQNQGTIDAANVQFDVQLPPDSTFVSGNASSGGCTVNLATMFIQCNVGTVPAFGSQQLVVTVTTANTPENVTATVTVHPVPDELDTANNTATVTTTVQ